MGLRRTLPRVVFARSHLPNPRKFLAGRPCDFTGIRDYAHITDSGGIQWLALASRLFPTLSSQLSTSRAAAPPLRRRKILHSRRPRPLPLRHPALHAGAARRRLPVHFAHRPRLLPPMTHQLPHRQKRHPLKTRAHGPHLRNQSGRRHPPRHFLRRPRDGPLTSRHRRSQRPRHTHRAARPNFPPDALRHLAQNSPSRPSTRTRASPAKKPAPSP